MDFFAYHCASGGSFFSGSALIVLACLAAMFKLPCGFWAVTRGVALLGVVLVTVSATPLPLIFYGVWAVVVLAWVVVQSAKPAKRKTISKPLMLRLAVLALTIIAVLWEIPYRKKPVLEGRQYDTLCVIGDSLSAGREGETAPVWPDIIEREHDIEVLNLSVPGATTFSAIGSAQDVPVGRVLVLIEIGGNDMLGGTPVKVYEKFLNLLLKDLQHSEWKLVMMELPLPMFKNNYGRVQRKLARKYNVTLIPKRFFANILAQKSSRFQGDAVHLSDQGHRRFAEVIWSIIQPVMRKQLLPKTRMAEL